MGEDITPETVDLASTQPPPTIEPSRVVPEGERFDPEPQRELVREKIALGLLGMLAVVLLFAFISIWLSKWLGMEIEMLRTVLTIIFGPLVTLVSAATGFYYGSRSSSP
jgi:hypothetical protein